MTFTGYSKLINLLLCVGLFSTVWAQHKRCGFDEVLELLQSRPSEYQRQLASYADFQRRAILNSRNFRRNQNTLTKPDSIVVLPIAFHIFHEDAALVGEMHNFSLAAIQGVVDALNADFGATNVDKSIIAEDFQKVDGGHVGIQFCIGKINRIAIGSCPNWNAQAGFNTMSQCLPGGAGPGSSNDPNDYLNFYVSELDGLLGIASCIPPVFGSCNTSTDGIIVNWDAFAIGNFFLGRTSTHEIGHWLGLPHVNGDINGAGCSGDDGFGDTNLQEDQQRYTCAGKIPLSCGSRDNVHNYMDYSRDCSITSFTQEQVAQMQAIMKTTRATLATSCARGNCNESLYSLSAPPIVSNNFQTLTFECSGAFNLLEISQQWYPANYNNLYSNGGLNYFYWADESGNIPGEYYDLANEEVFRSTNLSADTIYYTLLAMRWDPNSKMFGNPDTAGRVEVILNGSNCSPCTPVLSVDDIAGFLDNGCDNGITDELEWCFDWTCNEVFESAQLQIYRNNDVFVDTLLCGLYEFTYQNSSVDHTAQWRAAVRVDDGPWSDTIGFMVEAINTDCDPAANDNCIDALFLDVNPDYCFGQTVLFAGVSDDTAGQNIDCGSASADIWFYTSVPTSGNLIIQTFNSIVPFGNLDLAMQVYQASNCTDMTLIACSNDVEGTHPMIELTGLTAGEKIYIQIASFEDSETGYFRICAYEPSVEFCLEDESFSFYSSGSFMNENMPSEWSTILGGADAQVTDAFDNCDFPDRSILIDDLTESLHNPAVPMDFEVLEYSFDVFPADTSDMLIGIIHEISAFVDAALEINLYEGGIFVSSIFGTFFSGFYDDTKIARVKLIINRPENKLEIYVNNIWIDTYPFSISSSGIPNSNFAGINFSGFYKPFYVDCICYDYYDACIDTLVLASEGQLINSGTYTQEFIYSSGQISADSAVTFYTESSELLPYFRVDQTGQLKISLFPINCGQIEDVSRVAYNNKLQKLSRLNQFFPSDHISKNNSFRSFLLH